jgi:malonyl-CoA O-methyltransferase
MVHATPPAGTREVDPAALARTLRRWASAPEPPWLHAEVARRMAARLALVKRTPEVVVDWWSSTSASRELLGRAYPRAQLIRVEAGAPQASARSAAPRWWSPHRWGAARTEVHEATQPLPRPAQLLWANMALHVVADPEAELARWRRGLADGGFLMFSTLGPGSLSGLREVYARAGWPPPHAPFVDMHDLGDMLVRAGFTDPVMDQETLTLTWPDSRRMLDELRALGGNASPQRHAGLRTPRWRERLVRALDALAGADGRPRLDFEIVYGHAFGFAPRARVAPTTEVPLEDLRRQVREHRHRTAEG